MIATDDIDDVDDPAPRAVDVPTLARRLRALGHPVYADTWTTAGGAADALGVHPDTLRRWRAAGTGPRCYRLGPTGRALRYELEDLIAFHISGHEPV